MILLEEVIGVCGNVVSIDFGRYFGNCSPKSSELRFGQTLPKAVLVCFGSRCRNYVTELSDFDPVARCGKKLESLQLSSLV